MSLSNRVSTHHAGQKDAGWAHGQVVKYCWRSSNRRRWWPAFASARFALARRSQNCEGGSRLRPAGRAWQTLSTVVPAHIPPFNTAAVAYFPYVVTPVRTPFQRPCAGRDGGTPRVEWIVRMPSSEADARKTRCETPGAPARTSCVTMLLTIRWLGCRNQRLG